jgi:hypothetical protein
MDMSSMARMTYDGVVAQSVRCLKNLSMVIPVFDIY